MLNPMILLIAAGASIAVLSKKKKKESTVTHDEVQEKPERDSRELPKIDGVVLKGIRKDKRGHFPWRVYLDADGYHAQIMLDDSRFSPVQNELGVVASIESAKTMLRDHFNELLTNKYPNEKPKNDPPETIQIFSVNKS